MRIDREVLPFALVLLALALVAVLVGLAVVAPLPLALLAFTLWFFRDPERATPDDAAALFAPADGRIIRAGPDTVSIFMNVFNVHVCRAPAAGRVAAVEHRPGRFLAAFKEEAPGANERTRIVLDSAGPPLEFTLIAGLVARRIVCRVRAGQAVRAGERVGLIRFGSRVDVRLPTGVSPVVRIGDRVVAGETVLARRAPDAE
jgi:phosphatidylserine decarboxylase